MRGCFTVTTSFVGFCNSHVTDSGRLRRHYDMTNEEKYTYWPWCSSKGGAGVPGTDPSQRGGTLGSHLAKSAASAIFDSRLNESCLNGPMHRGGYKQGQQETLSNREHGHG
jgi:hypothetical protein